MFPAHLVKLLSLSNKQTPNVLLNIVVFKFELLQIGILPLPTKQETSSNSYLVSQPNNKSKKTKSINYIDLDLP